MVETEKTFGNNASQESVVPQPAYLLGASNISERENDLSPSVHQAHYRSASDSSTDSTTQLLSTAMKSSEYNATRVRQITGFSMSGTSHELEQSVTEEATNVHIVAPTPLKSRVNLAPLPHQRSLAGVHESSSEEEDEGHPRSPTDQIARRTARTPSLCLAEKLAEFPPVPFSAFEVTNKSATLAARLGLPSTTLTSVSPSAFPWRPLTPKQPSVRSDKSKRKSPPPFLGPFPNLSGIGPLPNFSENLEHSHADYRPSPRLSEPSSSSLSDIVTDRSGHSPGPSGTSYLEVSQLAIEPINHREKVTTDLASSPIVAISASPTPSKYQNRQSRRTTMTSVWSEESAWTKLQPPDAERPVACERIVPDSLRPGVWRGDYASVGFVPSRRLAIGPSRQQSSLLRPGKLASELTVRFTRALKSPRTPSEFTIVQPPQ